MLMFNITMPSNNIKRLHLNTSHVNVQLLELFLLQVHGLDLNTSHVNVQWLSIQPR